MGKASTLRNRIKAIAATVDGLTASRIKLGYVNFANNEEFFNSLPADGFFLVIHDSDNTSFDAGTLHGDYTIMLTLYYGFQKNQDYDFTSIEDTYEELRDELIDQTNWDGISNGPSSISQSKSTLSEAGTVITKCIELTLQFFTT